MKSTYMFPPAFLAGFAVIIALVFFYPKGDLKSLYQVAFLFVAFAGYLHFHHKQETDGQYRNFLPAKLGVASPLLLGAVSLSNFTQSVWATAVFLALLILHDWRLYETSPAGGLSIRHIEGRGIVWEDTSGMTPPEIRRMRKRKRSEE